MRWRIERGALRLPAAAPVLPAEPVFSVQGRIARLDLPPYLALWRAAATDAALPSLQGDVSAGELLLGGHVYPEVRVLAHTARHGGEFELQSALISGQVRWPDTDDARQPARLELARFDAAATAELMQAGALAAALAPATRLSVEDLRWQGRPLGRFTALVTNSGGDLTFGEARLVGANEDARGSATCHGATCSASFNLDSTDAQATLAAYGLRPDLEARRGNLSGELRWRREDASPLASLSGDLHMLITEGGTRVPGKDSTGAVFPLFVVPALLAGIAPQAQAQAPEVRFARLAASFELREGVATTADLHLDGDAEILVRGAPGARGPRLRAARPLCCAARNACRRRCAGWGRRRRWRRRGCRCATGSPARRRTQPGRAAFAGHVGRPHSVGAMTRGQNADEGCGRADDLRPRRGGESGAGAWLAGGGGSAGRTPGRAAGELLLHGPQGCRQARGGRGRRQRPGAGLPRRDRRRLGLWIVGGTVPCAPVPTGASPRPRWCSTPTAAARRALRQDPPVRRRHAGARRDATANRRTWPRARRRGVIDTPVGRLGLSVCYDVRFPELYRHLSAAGAQLLAMPSAFTSAHRARALGDAAARAGHRESLLRYRAGAVGLSPERARNLRRQHDRRLLGPRPAARAARPRLRGGGRGPGGPGGRAQDIPGAACTGLFRERTSAHE